MTIEHTLTELADRDRPLRSAPLTSLTGLTGDERVELAERWPALPVDRRRQVIEQLGDLAEDNVELDFDAVFLQALGDADAQVRVGAIRGLWEHSEREVIPLLIDLVQRDPAPVVRAEAALALGRFVMLGEFDEARPRDVEQITDALRAIIADGAESEEVRARAVESLGASSQPWARDLIHDAYDSGSSRLMAAAVHAMGRSADTYWLPTVLDELTNDDPEMRYEAAVACGMIEDEEAVPALLELLDDPDIEVREQVISSLGEIGGEEAIEAIRGQVNAAEARIAEAAQLALDQAEFGDDPLGFDA